MFTTTKEKKLWNRPTTVTSYFTVKGDKVPVMESAAMNDKVVKVWSKELISALSAKKPVKSGKAHEPRPYCYTLTTAEFKAWKSQLDGADKAAKAAAKAAKASAKKVATTAR